MSKEETSRTVAYATKRELNIRPLQPDMSPTLSLAPPQAVDLYYPAVLPSTPGLSVPHGFPVCFLVHGGAWHIGSKGKMASAAQALAESGYCVVVPSYPLSNWGVDHRTILSLVCLGFLTLLCLTALTFVELLILLTLTFVCFLVFIIWGWLGTDHTIQHPQHVWCLAQQVRWVHDHIAEYHGDPHTIHIMGHSAGGHLAALLATNFHFLSTVGVPTSDIASCVSLSGVLSDARMKQSLMGQQILHSTFGVREQYYDAFPIYHLGDDTPPLLLINGRLDLSLRAHSMDFHYAARQRDVYSEIVYMEECNHFTIHKNWNTSNRHTLDTIVQFLHRVEAFRQSETFAALRV